MFVIFAGEIPPARSASWIEPATIPACSTPPAPLVQLIFPESEKLSTVWELLFTPFVLSVAPPPPPPVGQSVASVNELSLHPPPMKFRMLRDGTATPSFSIVE